ncbi:MAG TPA: hypothetical protein VES65_01080 [Solirubrobacteraceae bacterium]|nr:hypothetical protein [Solirubrobacteraceae bacterium]
MRTSKLAPAAAAAALLVLAPAGASARPAGHKHPSPGGKCRISLIAEPHTITSGESVEVFGQLLCAHSSTEGQTVTVYEHSAGSPGFQVIGTPTTGAGGVYSLVPAAITTDSFFYARALGARSGTKAVRVAPVVTLSGPPEGTQLHTGFLNRVTFSGTVNPANPGAEVVLQRENATSSEEWHQIQRGFAHGGVYSLTHTFVVPGDANLRVLVRRHGVFTVRGISNTLSYEISQTQNPNLTIHSSADPVGYGSPITISGVLAGGAGKTVTLRAHPRGKAFATIATTTAGPGGEYKFVETPLQSTAYQATGGGLHSAVLFEGVKYLLTAGVSGKTVQSGQSVTFAGTVTPGNVGKVVYLERENAFGGGYHVVDAALVASGGTYSIPHFVFGVGKEVFRVKVPGDPSNQARSSAPFAIEVTPAPPGSLKPVAQPKQPSEGQV